MDHSHQSRQLPNCKSRKSEINNKKILFYYSTKYLIFANNKSYAVIICKVLIVYSKPYYCGVKTSPKKSNEIKSFSGIDNFAPLCSKFETKKFMK